MDEKPFGLRWYARRRSEIPKGRNLLHRTEDFFMSFITTAMPASPAKPSSKSKFTAKRLVTDALLAAIYFALTYFVIKPAGESLKITFASLALVVTALLFGPADACIVAFIGEFLYQTILYGVTATMPIWLIPPVLHAFLLGLFARLLSKNGKPLYTRIVPCYLVCVGTAILNSFANSAALYADSHIYGYYKPELVFGMMLIRILIATATALLIALVARTLVETLQKQHVV